MVGSSLSGDGGRGGGGEEEEVEEEEEEEEEEQQLGGNKNTTKKLATSWEQVAAMRKESVALRAQVAAATGVRARGVAGTTAVGPAAAAAAVADHHPPRVAATSRRVIRRDYPIFTPSYGDPDLLLPEGGGLGGGDSGNKVNLKHMKLHSTKHHQITSGQIWLKEHHLQHHCSAAQSVQHELQFVAPREGDLNVTPGNSFRSLPAHVRSSLSSPIPPPSLISARLSPANNVRRRRQQQLNRSLFTSPLQNLVQKSHHHNCDHPEFLQDSKLDENQLGRRRRRNLSPSRHHRQTSNNVIETSNTRSSSMEVPGLARDMGNQHRGNSGLPGSVLNPSVLPNTSNWGNCTSGGRSTVVPVAGIGGGGGSAATGLIIDPPKTVAARQQEVDEVLPPPQPPREQSAITATPSGYFNFLAWGGLHKKKPGLKVVGGSSHAMTSELSGRIINNNNTDQHDTIVMNLENTVKSLRSKLEESNKKRAAAVYEARALRIAMEILDEKFKQLQQQCQQQQQQQERSSQAWMTTMVHKRNLNLAKSELENFPQGEEDEEDDEDEDDDNNNTTTETATTVQAQRAAAAAASSSYSVHPKVKSKLFLTTVENARQSLKKLTDVICHHIWELGGSLTHVINSVLEKHLNLGIKPPTSRKKMPRAVKVLYFEAFVNQVMFESFENVDFDSNGARNILNQETLRATSLQSFQDLKKQEWGEIEKALSINPQSVIVSSSFHRFFIMRMEMVISQLGKLGEMNMPVSVITAFYNAVKGVWLVHHLTFAFKPAFVSIFRIAPGSNFDPMYMEEHNVPPIPSRKQDQLQSRGGVSGGGPHVSVMVSPGFIVDNKEVCKCTVLCCSRKQTTPPLT